MVALTAALRRASHVVVGYVNDASEAGMQAFVVHIDGVFRVGVKFRLDTGLLFRVPVVVFLRPNGYLFDHQGFAVRIELAGHPSHPFVLLRPFPKTRVEHKLARNAAQGSDTTHPRHSDAPFPHNILGIVRHGSR